MVYFISGIAASTELHSLFLHLTRAVKHRRLLKTFSRLVLISENVGLFSKTPTEGPIYFSWHFALPS